MQRTIYIIKPEVFEKREEISNVINQVPEIEIKKGIITAFTTSDISKLSSLDEGYSINRGLYRAYEHFLRAGLVEFGYIEGNNAIKDFKRLVGNLPNPIDCEAGTLRNTYGFKIPGVFKGVNFFLNAVHKSNNEHEASLEMQLFSEISKRSVVDIVSEMALRLYQSPPPEVNKAYEGSTMMIWEGHILEVVRFARELAFEVGANEEIVSIASYYHDIARLFGDDENHHLSGAVRVNELLTILNYEKTKEVRHCIESHRGSKSPRPSTLEARVVASADALATIARKDLLWYAAKNKHNLTVNEARKKVKEKLSKAKKRLMPEAKVLLKRYGFDK